MRIKTVQTDSLGEHLGLKPGDRLLKINNRKVLDPLDYRFRITDPEPTLELQIAGRREVVTVEKDADTDLGVEFEEFKIRSCANDCIFCFVDQNPAGLRDGLYFRDGDYRLSFLYGHYITMTNMGSNELERIVEQRLSPLYISVHATEPELRLKLLLYGKDDHLLDKIGYLVDNGIILHTQIVLCPTLNDGEHLTQTLTGLHRFGPNLRSVAIVPVGLTNHREGLPYIPPVTEEYARSLLAAYPGLHASFRHGDGRRFVFPSDEWYVLAGEEVPPIEFYGGTEIVENGVGQIRVFLDRFIRESRKLPGALETPAKFTIATGELAAPVFARHIVPALNRITNLSVELVPLRNTLFGHQTTVTGLLSGRDFIEQLQGLELGTAVWTSHRILNDAGTRTLDDMTLTDISTRLGLPLNVSRDSILEIFRRGIRG